MTNKKSSKKSLRQYKKHFIGEKLTQEEKDYVNFYSNILWQIKKLKTKMCGFQGLQDRLNFLEKEKIKCLKAKNKYGRIKYHEKLADDKK